MNFPGEMLKKPGANMKGIKGLLNFAPVILKTPDEIIVNNINLCDELESVIYYTQKDL